MARLLTRRTDPRRRLDARARRSELRRVRRMKRQGDIPMAFWVLLGVVAILTTLGLIVVFSVTTVTGYYRFDSAAYFFKRQGIFLGAGWAALYATYHFGYRRVSRLAGLAMIVSAILLVAVLFLGNEAKGATRWFSLGWLNFQPSELAKLAVVVWAARMLARREREMHDPRRTIVPVAIGLGVISFLILIEPDLGTVVVLCIVVATMLIVAGARLDWLFGMGIPALVVLGILSVTGYHAARWDFLNPFENTESSNYQLLGGLSSVASGGWFGVGPGGTTAKWGYLPEAHTDAIFAVIAEEMGIFGALAVICMYLVILGCGIHVARYAAERFGQLLAIGLTTMISVQAFVNIGVVLGVLPNKGFTLPFVSYGGTSLVMCMASVGLLLSVAREGDEEQARQRRLRTAHHRLERRAPSRNGLVLVASDGRPTVGGLRARATRRATASASARGGSRTRVRRTAPGRAASGRTASGRTASGRTAGSRGASSGSAAKRTVSARSNRAVASRAASTRRSAEPGDRRSGSRGGRGTTRRTTNRNARRVAER